MKKKIIPMVFSLFLLSGCGGEKTCEKHDYDDWKVTKNATCNEEGEQTRKCKVCGAEDKTSVPKIIHEYVDSTDQTEGKEANCNEEGVIITECKYCGSKSSRTTSKTTTHVWGEWQVETAATHEQQGLEKRTCSVCTDIETRPTEKDPNHNWDQMYNVEADHDMIGYQITNCPTDGCIKMIWNAKDVDNSTKTKLYLEEPNYKEAGDGIAFGGRPKGNGFDVAPTSKPSTFTFNADVPGSFIEYKFFMAEEVKECQLMADMESANWLDSSAGLFLNAAKGNDWTPGLVAATNADGYEIPKFRMDVYVNGDKLEMDETKNIAGETKYNRDWYDFPCKADLVKGENEIKIVMVGGWSPTFYNFGFISNKKMENSYIPSPSAGYEVQILGDDHVKSIKVYEDQACTILDDNAEGIYYSRNKWGRKTTDDGQVNFEIELENGYKIDEFTKVNGSFKNVKYPIETKLDCNKENVYRITKVAADTVVSIKTVEDNVVADGFKFTFAEVEHITVTVYADDKFENPETGNVAIARNKNSGEPTTVSDLAQVYVKIEVDSGFVLDLDSITYDVEDDPNNTKPYKNLRTPHDSGSDSTGIDDCYKFTKVNANATIYLAVKNA